MAVEVRTETTLDEEALASFAVGLRGPLLRPGDEGYEDARTIWNGLIDRRPALIVRCKRRGRCGRRRQLRTRAGSARFPSRAAATTSPATPSTTAAS